MFTFKRLRFESLEHRLCPAGMASVSYGDLVAQRDVDGAVEIVAVADGAYRVTKNGALTADETPLQGVTADASINSMLAGVTVDKVFDALKPKDHRMADVFLDGPGDDREGGSNSDDA